ncbi:OprD family outer membrane porin [Pseudomonas sp. NPDC007930]|uniref:OprD family porin n=1 Tax=Pseudomonas sp. NPDC007930 TaxID=3364417 RepID=UPI0036E99024
MTQHLQPWSTLALAVTLGLANLAQASEQSASNGFVEDSSLDLLARNLFWHQTAKGDPQRDWSQALMLNYSSGFTQGTLGVGVDAYGFLGLRLDGHSGHSGGPTVPQDSSGNPADSWAKAGGDVKLRIGSTTVKVGDLQPQAPVFATADNYLIPQTAEGFSVLSHDIAHLTLDAGRFTSGTGTTTQRHDGDIMAAYAGVTARSASYAGARYRFSPEFTAALYAGNLEDVWNQYYTNLNYAHAFNAEQALTLDGNLYRTLDAGSAKAGPIDTTAFSLSAAFTQGPHTFTLAGQHVNGDEPFDYAGFGSTRDGVAGGRYGNGIFLADSLQYSDFNGPHETSLQARYDLDLSTLGVPGLGLMARYVHGSGIDGSHTPGNSAYAGFYGHDDSEHETDAEVKYTVPSGPAKHLTIHLRQAWHSGDAATGGHLMQTRLITEYPLSIF